MNFLRPLLRSWWPRLFALSLTGLACGDAPKDPDEVEYGLGSKADGIDGCDPGADLCWGSDDSAMMREVMLDQDRLLAGVGDGSLFALRMLDGLAVLEHKLTPAEIEALQVMGSAASALGASPSVEQVQTFLEQVAAAGYARLLTTYIAAYMVPVGASAQQEVLGAADDPSSPAHDLPSLSQNFSADMAQSLQMLRDTGAFGTVYAFMLEHTGILEDPYMPFDELWPFSEPREDRAERIIDHWQRWAGASAFASGLESLIPVAGLPMAIAHDQFFAFRIRTRMSLELAALYGIDIRQGDNLFRVMATFMAQQSLPSTQAEVFGWAAARVLANVVVRKGIGISAEEAVRRLAGSLVADIARAMATEGAEVAAKAATKGTARALGQQILGWATFGLSVLGDVVVSVHVTGELGEGIDTTFRPWGTGMLHTGAAFVSQAEGRDCAALMLGTIMGADGVIADAEKDLLAAHLARLHFTEGSWVALEQREVQTLAARAASVGLAGTTSYDDAMAEVAVCAPRQWEHLTMHQRMSVLETATVLGLVDGALVPAEQNAYLVPYLAIHRGLDDNAEAMSEMLDALLAHPEDLVAPQDAELVTSLEIADVLPFLREVPAMHATAVACAFDGICD